MASFLVINKIDKLKRFPLENVILGAVWSGLGKPSREQTYLLFDHVVEQLKELEKGKIFQVFVSSEKTEGRFLKARTFLSTLFVTVMLKVYLVWFL